VIKPLEGTGDGSTSFSSGPSSSSSSSGSAPKGSSSGPSSTDTPKAPSVPGKKYTLHGKWVIGKTAGGSPTQPQWKETPQYILEVSTKTKIEISLVQPKSPKDGKFLHIGFFVFKADLPAKKKKINTRDLVYQSQLINSDDVTAVIDMEPGTYNIVACTYHPNMENSYSISVTGACFTSPKEFYEISPELDWKSVTIHAEWRKGKDGGCSNHATTWKDNPQFLITCSQKQTVKILLETERDVPVGFYLYKTNDGKTTDESLPSSPFVSGLSLGKVTSMKDYVDFLPGKYILRATTFTPNIHEKFTISVLAERVSCSISEI